MDKPKRGIQMTFEELKIDQRLIKALEKRGITEPTDVQESVIKLMLDKKDVIAKSQTGSGKTLAYLLPVFMAVDTALRSTQAIILTPTHELAVQVHNEAEFLSRNTGMDIRSALIIGGANITRQIERLKEKPQIVIGSTGRIYDLIKKHKIQAHTVKIMVIDEADRMLDDDNIDGVRKVIKTTLKDSRQTVILSASLGNTAISRAKEFMHEPVMAKGADDMPAGIEHYYIICQRRDKIVQVRKIMAGLKPKKVMLFINNQQETDEMVEKLRFHGLLAGGIYGAAKKNERRKAIEDFRSGRINMLISSDITARGMDFEDVDMVINIDIPEEPIFYQHRAGRTGRGGKKGVVISLISPFDKKWINKYEKAFNIKFKAKEMSYGRLIDAAKDKNFKNKAKSNNGKVFK